MAARVNSQGKLYVDTLGATSEAGHQIVWTPVYTRLGKAGDSRTPEKWGLTSLDYQEAKRLCTLVDTFILAAPL